jgi:hypothetical protein
MNHQDRESFFWYSFALYNGLDLVKAVIISDVMKASSHLSDS